MAEVKEKYVATPAFDPAYYDFPNITMTMQNRLHEKSGTQNRGNVSHENKVYYDYDYDDDSDENCYWQIEAPEGEIFCSFFLLFPPSWVVSGKVCTQIVSSKILGLHTWELIYFNFVANYYSVIK